MFAHKLVATGAMILPAMLSVVGMTAAEPKVLTAAAMDGVTAGGLLSIRVAWSASYASDHSTAGSSSSSASSTSLTSASVSSASGSISSGTHTATSSISVPPDVPGYDIGTISGGGVTISGVTAP